MHLASPRLQMTPLQADDWPLFQTLHHTEQVTALCFDTPTDAELKAKFDARLQPWHAASTHWLCLTIRLRDNAEAIGVTGLALQQGLAEVGYLLLPQFYGQGYASESLKALITWAQNTHNIQRFSATVTAGNIGSEKVLQKCGFSLYKTVPDAYQIGGKRYADHLYILDGGPA